MKLSAPGSVQDSILRVIKSDEEFTYPNDVCDIFPTLAAMVILPKSRQTMERISTEYCSNVGRLEFREKRAVPMP